MILFAVGKRLSAGAAALVLLAGAVFVLHFVDPVKTAGFPRCPVFVLTGLQCPGCGTARALRALAHGDVWAFVHYNAVLLFVIPLLAALAVRPKWALNPALGRVIVGTIVAWTILRNVFPTC